VSVETVVEDKHDSLQTFSDKEELDRLVDTRVLAQVDEPTDWVDQMAGSTKKNGSLRICIYPRSLNLALKREH